MFVFMQCLFLKSMKVMVQNDRQEGQGLFGGGKLAAFADAAASSPHRLIRACLWS